MAAGTASNAELRQLIALCNAEGDQWCRNAAFARWKARQDAGAEDAGEGAP